MKRKHYHLIELREDFAPEKDWAVFLDRDGVVIKERHLLCDLKDLVFLPRVGQAIQFLNKKKIPVFLTTNQTVVARGLCKEDFIFKTHEKIKGELSKSQAFLDGIFCCLHSRKADIKKYRYDCSWRKPKTGMFEFIAKIFNLKLKKSFLIGDKARDVLVAQKLGMRDILVRTGYAGKDSLYQAKPSVIKKDLLAAVRYILKQDG